MATNFRVTSYIVHVHACGRFRKICNLRDVRCPGHWRILVSDFLSPSLLTMGVEASDGTRFGRWPEVSRCPDLLGPLKHSPQNAACTQAPPLWPEGARSARAWWKFYLLPQPLPKCMPNMGRVGSCKSKSWSRSNRRASYV